MSKIKSIKAREILDSKGNPTVEVDLTTDLGTFRASVPSGVSKGKYEAVEIRDGGKRYFGKGVLKAVKIINQIIGPKLRGKRVKEQKKIDDFLIKLDGTKNKSKLGANSLLPVSIAVCRAVAAEQNLSLYTYISKLAKEGPLKTLPQPCFLLLEGGLHSASELAIQEFMIVPQIRTFFKALQAGSEIYQTLKEILRKKIGKEAINLGLEGGFAPPLNKTQEALNLIIEAIKKAGYQNKVKIILDIAASCLYQKGIYKLEGMSFSREKLLKFYFNLIKKYPLVALEDPFDQEDWQSWKMLKSKVESEKSKVLILGDDLLATNLERVKKAVKEKACNGLILKPNQIGTISETIEVAKYAKENGWQIFVKHRSGETNDDFLADLAVGLRADYLMAGAPARGERVAKYNRLLRIEEELKKS
jgi:enolase